MARILFLTQVLPYPLDTGAKIREYYVLRYLTRQHRVTVVAFVRPDDRPEDVAHLQEFCEAVHVVPMRRSLWRNGRAALKAAITGQSAIIVRDEIAEMHRLLRRLVRQNHFDVIHADQTSMAQYALFAKQHNPRPVKLLLDAHNALYRIPERLAAHEQNPLKRGLLRREANALTRYETALWEQFDHLVFVANQDRQALQTRLNHPDRKAPHTTIPICVDPAAEPVIPPASQAQTITHLGTMFWPPNVEGMLWYTREVFPQVQAQVPGVKLVIIGKNPPAEIQALSTQFKNVEVAGYVADPVPWLAETAVFIVPVRAAGGMRVKIPTAWCWGVPIVSTTIGAEGIELKDGTHALIADYPDELTAATVRLLKNRTLADSLRRNGRRWVEERYNWRRTYKSWDYVYDQLIPTPEHVQSEMDYVPIA